MMMNQQPMGVAPVVVVQSPKSVGVAVVLSFFFGPLGMFYSTITGALVMLGVNFVIFFIGLLTVGIGWSLYLFTWIGGIIWAAVAADSYNKSIAVAAVPVAPAVVPGVMMPSPYQGQSGPYQQPGSSPNPYQGQSGPYQQPGSMPAPYQGQSGPYQQPGSVPNSYQQPPQYPG